ncbi:MAG: tRNA (adenosine(37)-N6)-threonylcarbamoyltransferase complex dimerization subunit type 1 TsaB [Desulfobacteraceae bacterium]
MILAFNTSTPQFSIALMREEGTILSEYYMASGSKNFRRFMPGIDFLLASSDVDPKVIKALIVATGPGSFTGLRVGLSEAKGMAQGLQIPIIGVSSLEAMAAQLPFASLPVCAIIDSRKGEVFAALFTWGDDQKMIRTQQDTCLRIEDLPSVIEKPTIFLGNHFNTQGHLIREMFGPKAELAPAYLWNLKASAVGTLGLKRFLDQDFDDLQELVPTYLRPPDIRPNPYAPKSEKIDTNDSE